MGETSDAKIWRKGIPNPRKEMAGESMPEKSVPKVKAEDEDGAGRETARSEGGVKKERISNCLCVRGRTEADAGGGGGRGDGENALGTSREGVGLGKKEERPGAQMH